MRILIVEDDKKVGQFLLKGLKEEHYAVDLVRNGEDALYYCRINNYNVIILDIMLPIKDGLTVCRELRSNKVTTPILMLTAKDSIEDKINGLNEGADDYLTKPFSFDELLARIRSLFRRQQEYKTENLRCGELELNPLHRTVTLKKKNINLTGREFAILEYLMRNKGKIVTPSMIIDHVWDMSYEGISNMVNVYIARLRRKIDPGKGKKFIQTIRGHGYKIDES